MKLNKSAMEKSLKRWLEKAFDAGYKAGYSAIDVDGFRNENGYFSFDEWIEFIEKEEDEISAEHGICMENGCEKPATKDYNGHGHWVCDYHYKKLNDYFDEEYD